MKSIIILLLSLTALITYGQTILETSDIKQKHGGLHPSQTTIRTDEFLPDSITKSSLYSYIEAKMREELKINDSTPKNKFPSIRINKHLCFLKDLNDLEYNEV